MGGSDGPKNPPTTPDHTALYMNLSTHQPVVHYNLSSTGGLGPVALNTGRVPLMPPVMGNTSPTQMTPQNHRSILKSIQRSARLVQIMMLAWASIVFWYTRTRQKVADAKRSTRRQRKSKRSFEDNRTVFTKYKTFVEIFQFENLQHESIQRTQVPMEGFNGCQQNGCNLPTFRSLTHGVGL